MCMRNEQLTINTFSTDEIQVAFLQFLPGFYGNMAPKLIRQRWKDFNLLQNPKARQQLIQYVVYVYKK